MIYVQIIKNLKLINIESPKINQKNKNNFCKSKFLIN